MRRPDGFGLIEVVLAALVLALAVASLMVLSSQESRSVAISRERYLATVRLRELAACFGDKSRPWFEASGLPKTLPDWDSRAALFESLLGEHPAFLAPGRAERAPLVGAELLAESARLGIAAAILYEPFTSPEGRKGGLVTLNVRFQEGPAGARELVSHRVVY